MAGNNLKNSNYLTWEHFIIMWFRCNSKNRSRLCCLRLDGHFSPFQKLRMFTIFLEHAAFVVIIQMVASFLEGMLTILPLTLMKLHRVLLQWCCVVGVAGVLMAISCTAVRKLASDRIACGLFLAPINDV